ncbi:hypothetical protein Vretimale_6508 [Volvox reticuliferus]|uniref:Uncharacterized protein n=1 Tax=Volvox reticuliferus TaxID=1737510 RepID=A0A8J4FIM0_9CHLO|nr:hypothetical protein Vretifemale_7345 [Volvox reticuliferus]GIM01804.1 hypothetical protein Vretimale_6508 [Volvox reticuliferus]
MAEEQNPASPLYHMVQKEIWVTAKQSNQPYFPPTYEQDGFIHLTADPGFLLGIGNHFYRSVPGDFLLLVLDPAKLTAKVVFEAAAPVGSKSTEGLLMENAPREGREAESTSPLFPHLYGTIDYHAVQSELAIQRDADGVFLSIPCLVPGATGDPK